MLTRARALAHTPAHVHTHAHMYISRRTRAHSALSSHARAGALSLTHSPHPLHPKHAHTLARTRGVAPVPRAALLGVNAKLQVGSSPPGANSALLSGSAKG